MGGPCERPGPKAEPAWAPWFVLAELVVLGELPLLAVPLDVDTVGTDLNACCIALLSRAWISSLAVLEDPVVVVVVWGDDLTTKLALPNPPGRGKVLDAELVVVELEDVELGVVELVAVGGAALDVVVVDDLVDEVEVDVVLLCPRGGDSPILTEIGPAWTTADTEGITNTRALSWRGGGLEKFSIISDIACCAWDRK